MKPTAKENKEHTAAVDNLLLVDDVVAVAVEHSTVVVATFVVNWCWNLVHRSCNFELLCFAS